MDTVHVLHTQCIVEEGRGVGVHTCVCGSSEWSVEYCTYQTSVGGWCTVWRGGTCARAHARVCMCVHSICAGHVFLQQ